MKYYVGPYQQKKVAPLAATFYRGLPDGAVGGINLSSLAHPDVGFFCAPDGVILNSTVYRELGRGDLRDIAPRESERAVFASLIGARVDGDKLIDWLYTPLTINADPTGENAPRPLMPTVERELDISLHGHGLLKRQPFALGIPEAGTVIALLKREYEETRRATLDGKRGRVGPDLEYHRKWLDYQGEKFGIDKPEDVFIRAGLPKETRVKHATTISDDFNRTNADPVSNAAAGWSWTQVVNVIQLISNTVFNKTGGYVNCYMRAESDVSSSDHYVQAAFGLISADSTVSGVCARYASGSDTKYQGYWNTFSLLLECVVGTNNTVPVLGDVIKLQCNGSSIKLFLNAVEKISGTDTSITGNTRGGIYELGASANNSSMDGYLIEDLAVLTSANLLAGKLGMKLVGKL